MSSITAAILGAAAVSKAGAWATPVVRLWPAFFAPRSES